MQEWTQDQLWKYRLATAKGTSDERHAAMMAARHAKRQQKSRAHELTKKLSNLHLQHASDHCNLAYTEVPSRMAKKAVVSWTSESSPRRAGRAAKHWQAPPSGRAALAGATTTRWRVEEETAGGGGSSGGGADGGGGGEVEGGEQTDQALDDLKLRLLEHAAKLTEIAPRSKRLWGVGQAATVVVEGFITTRALVTRASRGIANGGNARKVFARRSRCKSADMAMSGDHGRSIEGLEKIEMQSHDMAMS